MDRDSGACGETQNDSDKKLVEDGPLDPNKYWEPQQIRVLHLFKEPTEPYKSLRDALEKSYKDGKLSQRRLWKITAIRSYFIDNFRRTKLSWKDIETLTNEILYEAILSSAIVNLSKKVGLSSTSPDKLSTLAKENFDIWFKQLQDNKPHIIICGGTYGVVKRCIKKSVSIEIDEKISSGMQYFKTIGAFFLDCWHPSFFKCKQCVEYAYFAESVAALFEKEKKILT